MNSKCCVNNTAIVSHRVCTFYDIVAGISQKITGDTANVNTSARRVDEEKRVRRELYEVRVREIEREERERGRGKKAGERAEE